jgi:reactive intermediate/imine deaminase
LRLSKIASAIWQILIIQLEIRLYNLSRLALIASKMLAFQCFVDNFLIMKTKLSAILLCLFVFQNIMGQQTEIKPADPADVASVEAIIKAVYDVISGEAGQKRNWDRFHSLFYKDARLIPTAKDAKTNLFGANPLTTEGYIKRVEPIFANQGFYEKEIARKTDTYGNIVQAFSTYEARRTKDDEKPFLRGINSFQLLFDGNRWWVVSIFWQAETPDNPIPDKYERSQIEYLSSEVLKGYPFSESVRVGNLIYLSGQIGTDTTGKLVAGGIAAETKQTLENIKVALERQNSSLDNVVKCLVMIADMKEWAEMNKVYVTYFKNKLPARSSFGATGLALNARVEIECIAIVK